MGKFGKRLTLTVELYETRGAKLVGSLSVENSDADGILVSIDEKAPFLFGKLRGTSWVPAIVQTENSVLSPAQSVNILRDSRDGRVYKTVQIGPQIWMTENLNYSTKNSWCYDKKSDNCKKYGRLYSWRSAMGF